MSEKSRATQTLVFDLDGTLSDPAVGIGRSLNFALEAFGHRPIPAAEVSRYIGPPLDESFRIITGESEVNAIAQLVAKYRERYAEIGFAENSLYPGIPEAIATLAERGHPMGVCTSKRLDFAEKILELFGLRRYFQFVSGGDIGVSKAQQLAHLVSRGGVDLRATMIGDRAVDINAAKLNGLSSVGVLWGHGSRQELVGAGPQLILGHVDELLSLSNAA